MSIHLHKEIQRLKQGILSIGATVEDNVRKAVEAVETRNTDLAKELIETDYEVDHMEVDLEERSLMILALYHPVAVDLRFVVGVIKVNNDLERIGDLSVNIAERVGFLASQEKIALPFDFFGMAERVQAILKNSLDALVNMDIALAKKTRLQDDEVDEYNARMFEMVKDGLHDHTDQIDYLIHLLCISRHLERIADLATNICEDIIYMVEGEIVRHQAEDFSA
ncbi:MAG: phosphate signaling complex protein PhoU [Candidatus Sumerlaeota bacterium]